MTTCTLRFSLFVDAASFGRALSFADAGLDAAQLLKLVVGARVEVEGGLGANGTVVQASRIEFDD